MEGTLNSQIQSGGGGLRYPKEVNWNESMQGAMEMVGPAVSLTRVLSLHPPYIGETGWF